MPLALLVLFLVVGVVALALAAVERMVEVGLAIEVADSLSILALPSRPLFPLLVVLW